MELKDLEETVEDMILQHNYPGYEVRSLNLTLPTAFHNVPAKTYAQALQSNSIYVQLAALRWFQTKVGLAKNYTHLITCLLKSSDAWVKTEAIRTIELTKIFENDLILKVLPMLNDSEAMVRIAAAKALGSIAKEVGKSNLSTKTKQAKNLKSEKIQSIQDKIITALREASEDKDINVRRKAIKSLRKLGAFSTF